MPPSKPFLACALLALLSASAIASSIPAAFEPAAEASTPAPDAGRGGGGIASGTDGIRVAAALAASPPGGAPVVATAR